MVCRPSDHTAEMPPRPRFEPGIRALDAGTVTTRPTHLLRVNCCWKQKNCWWRDIEGGRRWRILRIHMGFIPNEWWGAANDETWRNERNARHPQPPPPLITGILKERARYTQKYTLTHVKLCLWSYLQKWGGGGRSVMSSLRSQFNSMFKWNFIFLTLQHCSRLNFWRILYR